MSDLKQEFENWAISHGGLSLIPANGGECGNGWFPATYAHSMTEIAWRAFANRRTQPEAPKPAQDLSAAIATALSQPYGWVQFIDGVKTQNFARDEKELNDIKMMFRLMKRTGKAEYLPVYASPADALVAGDRVDAERYRWLRNPDQDVGLVLDKRTGYVPPDESIPGIGGYHIYEYRAGEELDAAIDAAILQSQKGNHG